MPAALVIPAVASVIGAGAAYAGSRSASKAQQKATDQAIAYETKREADRQKRRDAARATYVAQVKDWYRRYGDAGLARYGYPPGIDPSVFSAAPAAGTGAAPTGAPVSLGPAPAPSTGYRGAPTSTRIGDLMNLGAQQKAASAGTGLSAFGAALPSIGAAAGAAMPQGLSMPKNIGDLASNVQFPAMPEPATPGLPAQSVGPVPLFPQPAGGWSDWRNYGVQ